MCGIACFLYKTGEPCDGLQKLYEECTSNLHRRGPNSLQSCTIQHNGYTLVFTASVLWLQGKQMTVQPLVTNNSVFVYNGDVFGGSLISEERRGETGDTVAFLEALETGESVLETLWDIQGPFAFIYLDKRSSKLYFTRDAIGRRSLLVGKDKSAMVITSVAVKTNHDIIELPTVGIFQLDLITGIITVDVFNDANNNNNKQKLKAVESSLRIKFAVDDHYPAEADDFIEPTETDLRIFKEISGLEPIAALEYLNVAAPAWSARVHELHSLLDESVRVRVSAQPNFCGDCLGGKSGCDHAKVGVLFSGGLDCSVLALLADKYVPKTEPIDLMNVAFSSPCGYSSPDRISGLETLQELQRLCPWRTWNFLSVDVSKKKELKEMMEAQIKHLIFPLRTIMDDGLGCALWFASRGKTKEYSSPCRVLLVGMGADELFGGYTRHRAALKRSGWLGLHKSLQFDWRNISHRNLARDDRVVSDHGRQLRTPYLDEHVVEYLQCLRAWEKTCPSDELAVGLGEKVLLRSLAYRMGLRGAACLVKRALQFGSRIANKNEKAHEDSPRL